MFFPRRCGVGLLLLLAACAPKKPPVPAGAQHATVCRSCFWDYQPQALKTELISIYRSRRFGDPLVEAERKMLLANVLDDPRAACRARGAFARLSGTPEAAEPGRALIVAETLAFTASACGEEPSPAFRIASARARLAEDPWKAQVYAAVADGRFSPRIGATTITKKVDVPKGATSYVLGASRIVVRPGERVGAQIDRTLRDWLSFQLAWDGAAHPIGKDELLTWHEGARLRDLLDAVDAQVFPLTGALAIRRDGRWLAAGGDGEFRYEILEDKIQYPTTLVAGDLALMVDTHGISAIVAPASREGAELVVGCGDAEAKMKAAYDLARGSIDVWFPCDRFVGDLVGYDAPGVLIGSAPVRREGDHAVIGDRPVAFAIDETIVAEDFQGTGPLRYDDAPARYFRALAALAPIRIDYAAVEDAGQTGRVIDRARALGASAVGVRVQTPEDAAPVRAWLAADPSHRAVLFHSVPYPAGCALFEEFPRQTTFGDARPVFR